MIKITWYARVWRCALVILFAFLPFAILPASLLVFMYIDFHHTF
jgi:hypothetical protein